MILRSGWFIGSVFMIALIGALLRPFPATFKWRHGGDCVRYLTWSKVVKERGMAAFPALVKEYRERWVGFPPPTRWSYLMMIAGVMKLWPSPADEYHPLVLISWLAGVLAIFPLALWLRRLAPWPVTLLSCLFVATSPLLRGMSHMPLPDSLHLFVALGLFACIQEALVHARPWLYACIAFFALMAVTTRETGLFTLFGAGALVVMDRQERGVWRLGPLWAMLAGCLVTVAITAGLAGGPTQLALMTYDVVHGALYTTGSKAYVSGPYYTYLVHFFMISPVVGVVSIAALRPLWHHPQLSRLARPTVTASLVMLVVFFFLPKSMRYVMVVDAGLRVLCAGAVWAVLTSLPRAKGQLVGSVLLVLFLAHDAVIHRMLWGNDQIYDPVTWSLARGLYMIPQ